MIRFVSILLAVSLLFSVVSLRPNRAEAVVGAATLDPGVALAGAAILGTVLVVGAATEKVKNSRLNDFLVLGFLAGLIILDNGPRRDLKYVPVTARAAAQAEMTSEERDAYNDSTEEINAVTESVVSDLTQSQNKSVRFAKSRWEYYGQVLDPLALSGVQKVSYAAIRKMDRLAQK